MPIGRSFREAIVTFLILFSAFLAFGQNPQPHPTALAAYIPRVAVPDVRGRSLAEAQRALELAGLKLGKTSQAAGPGIVGTVEQQEPAQYSTAVRGSLVSLVLVAPSQGQTPGHSDDNFTVQVPALNGLTQNEASNRLEKLHLLLGAVSEGPGKGTIDSIYDQRPGQGSWVKQWTKIDVKIVQSSERSPGVNQPPPYVIVPDLHGQTRSTAAEILLKYGLRLGDVSEGPASMPTGTIYAQVPVAGAKVPSGSSVRAYIAQVQSKPLVTVPDVSHMDIAAARAVLAGVGLLGGDVSSEESHETPNSVTSQSPQSGMQVERGSLVNLVVAQPFPTVEVPNLIKHDEEQAISMLREAGLQMGSISEQPSTLSSGTVLRQNPQSGSQVLKGTNVDVVLSRQVLPQLTLMLSSTKPEKGEGLTLHAHLEPPHTDASYRFEFGDGQSTKLLPTSVITHTYRSNGDFKVLAFAEIGTTSIQSDPVTISIHGPPIGLLVGIGAGTVVLAFGGFLLHGRIVFHRLIRVVPTLDPGAQRISMDGSALRGRAVQVRLQEDPGEQSIYLSTVHSFRKEDR